MKRNLTRLWALCLALVLAAPALAEEPGASPLPEATQTAATETAPSSESPEPSPEAPAQTPDVSGQETPPTGQDAPPASQNDLPEKQSRILRVGLGYGSSAAPFRRLQNYQNTGYQFGYFDENRAFVPLGSTQETKITVLITQNLYLQSNTDFSYDSTGAKGSVGCYHVHLPETYADFPSAQAAADQLADGFVAWIDGIYYVRTGSFTSKAAARDAVAQLGIEGASVGETSGYGYSVVTTGSTRILFQFDSNKSGELGAFGVMPGLEEGVAPITWTKNYRYYGGFRFERINGGESTIVNMVELEDYVKGVIPYEMSPSWPLEALKAQAVCARTYGLGKVVSSDHSRSYHFDICTSDHCQVYYGTSRAGETSDRAVDETAGQLIYYNGQPAYQALYSSSHGGASEDAKNVWGNEVPYLKGIIDPYEADIADIAGNFNWTKTYTASSLKERLHSKGYPCADIVDFSVTRLSATGNVIEIKILDSSGKTWTFSRSKVRSILGTNSIRFQLSASASSGPSSGYAIAGETEMVESLQGHYAIGGDGTISEIPEDAYVITAAGTSKLTPSANPNGGDNTVVYTLKGTGWGHNVGMSQWGAYAMANRGMTYLDILHFYYTGITVE